MTQPDWKAEREAIRARVVAGLPLWFNDGIANAPAIRQIQADLRRLLDRADEDEREREAILTFFGATEKEDGSLSVNMPKYHAAHLCQAHQFEFPKLKDVERCVLCIAAELTLRDQRISELKAEVKVDDELLAERQRLLDAFPGCEAHGKSCVPHAIEYLTAARKANEEVVCNRAHLELEDV